MCIHRNRGRLKEIGGMVMMKGKVALITGAGKGIGAAIARTMAEHGATVIINYSHSKRLHQR